MSRMLSSKNRVTAHHCGQMKEFTILVMYYPEKFSNISLRIGGFHLQKVVIGCLRAYLDSNGIQNLMVEEEISGAAFVNLVMNGGNNI